MIWQLLNKKERERERERQRVLNFQFLTQYSKLKTTHVPSIEVGSFPTYRFFIQSNVKERKNEQETKTKERKKEEEKLLDS
jgi:hypothetical protein